MNLPASRLEHFKFFNGFEAPFVNICWEIETDDFTVRCKEHGLSSYHFLVHSLCEACFEVDAFLWRLDEHGKPVKVTTLTPSFTIMKDDGNFNFCTLPFVKDIKNFDKACEARKAQAKSAPGLSHDEPGRIDYLFITSIPWMRFTFIQHPVHTLKRVHIPSFAFGKFIVEGGRIRIPFAVQGHHGFVDGVHMHKLEEALKNALRKNLPQTR